MATDAEAALGAGRDHRSMLGVFWGTGVGGGIVLDGRPWVGRGGAGEIGHVVVKVDGERCPCGRRGCVEAYAGRNALERRARELHERGEHTELFKIAKKRGRERLTSGIWAAALERRDPLATKLIDRAVEMLGAGVASVDNVLDVEVIILGGGLGVRLGQPYADRIAQAMLPHLFFSDRPPPVVVAALGDLGGAIGASLLDAAVSAARQVGQTFCCAARSSSSGLSANFIACSVAGSVSIPRAASSSQMRCQASRRGPVGGWRRRSDICTDSSSAASLERSQRTLVDAGCGSSTCSPASVSAKRRSSTIAKSASSRVSLLSAAVAPTLRMLSGIPSP